MRTKFPGILSFVLLTAVALPGWGNITYVFSPETIGPYLVTGTITTDGNSGTLAASDIVSWDLTATGVPFTLDIDSADAEFFLFFQGSDLSATSTQLLFDLDGSDVGEFGVGDAGSNWHVETLAADTDQADAFWGADVSASRVT